MRAGPLRARESSRIGQRLPHEGKGQQCTGDCDDRLHLGESLVSALGHTASAIAAPPAIVLHPARVFDGVTAQAARRAGPFWCGERRSRRSGRRVR